MLFLIFGMSIYTTAMSVSFLYGLKDVIHVFQFFKEALVLSLLGISIYTLKARPKFGLIDYLIFGYLAYTMLYAILPIGEQSFFERLIALKSMAFYIVVYFTGRLFDIRKIYVNKYFNYIALLTIAAGAITFFERLFNLNLQSISGYADYVYYFFNFEPSGNYGLSWTFESEGGYKRFGSFFDNPLEHAAATLLALSVIIALYTRDDNKFKPNTTGLLALGASLLSITFAFSRAPFISYFFVIYIYALITKKTFITKTIHYTILAGVCYVAYIISTWGNKVDGIMEVIINTIDFSNPSSIGHLVAWVDGINAMIQHPFGLGLGASGRVAGTLGETVGGENQFIIIGVQGGIIALTLYLAIYITFIKQGLKWLNLLKGKERKICLAVLLMKIGFLIPMFTSEVESSSYISYMNWFLSGLFIATIMQHTAPETTLAHDH
ncbi:O-antigen ligase family protein [Mucilaginibacter polytrichastri]|uniref:O-antigen polymerase n=1 Tax=Mucilaginibacter polytrichastri TaxID=1302689 RepID=A0A1Q5ZYV0_9SPHI|nr:hypothetical protein [Mucilaginibacter polytrichastri]OKS86918.1 hypothetical protein RG47T_2376 [Mucilaginibacter polytrichastri]SFT18023.1 hypothetical protein SAMN04487890_114101 [Mucilaginibacter polytrichastri]